MSGLVEFIENEWRESHLVSNNDIGGLGARTEEAESGREREREILIKAC